MDRAHSLLEIKSIDRAERVIEGIASTPEVDRGGDSLDPAGAQFRLPMPFLWQHGEPIGEVFAATVKSDGIHIRARISRVDPTAPAGLSDRLETAWHSISAQPPLVRGLSIGWKPLQFALVKGIRQVSSWMWGETSAVVVPMNASSLITSVKSLAQFDHASALSGASAVTPSSGVPDLRRKTAMNVSELLTAAKNDLQVKSTRFEELMNLDQTNGGLETEDVTERDGLIDAVKSLTQKVNQLSTLEAAQMAQSSTLTLPSMQMAPATRTTPQIQFQKKEYPKGTHFVRTAMAIAAGKGSYSDTIAYTKRYFGDMPELVPLVKTMMETKAVEGTSVVASPGWGGELVNPNTAQTEFVELLMPQTIIGQVQGFRRVPFNIPIIVQTGGSTFEWVGEGAPKPVGELAFTRTTMGYTKCAGIIVMTEELTRLSTPGAEALARQDLIDGCRKFIDEQFIQVGIAASATNPASITYGVTSPGASGTDVDALMKDLAGALATFTSASIPTTGLAIVTTPSIALGISMLTTTLGTQPPGVNVTPTGGTVLGYQVVVSESVDPGVVVIFKPSEIFLADDGQVRLDASNQATLDMSGGSTPAFSLWQNNCVGLRAERWINWQKRRADVVAVIDTAAYGPS